MIRGHEQWIIRRQKLHRRFLDAHTAAPDLQGIGTEVCQLAGLASTEGTALAHVVLDDERSAVVHVFEKPVLISAKICADVISTHAGHDGVEHAEIPSGQIAFRE